MMFAYFQFLVVILLVLMNFRVPIRSSCVSCAVVCVVATFLSHHISPRLLLRTLCLDATL